MNQPEAVEQISPLVAVRLLADGAALIDVREPEEWQIGRAPEAQHIPLGELGARLGELPVGRRLIMVCRSGARSNAAAITLVGVGFPALNLAGGMQAWKQAALPVVTDGELPGDVA